MRLWSTPPVSNRVSELSAHRVELVYGIGQNLLWDSLGYILVLRSPTLKQFFTSLLCTLSFNLLETTSTAYFHSKKNASTSQTKVQDVEDHEVVINVVASNDVEATQLETLRSKNSTTFTGSMAALESTKYRSESVQIAVDEVHMDELEEKGFVAAAAFSADDKKILFRSNTNKNIRKSKSKSDVRSTPEPSTLHISTLSPSEHQTSDLKTHPEIKEEPPPFVPTPPNIHYWFLRVGSLTSDLASMAFAMVLLLVFTSLGDTPNWSHIYVSVPPMELLTSRFCVAIIMNLTMSVASITLETKILGCEVEECLGEVKDCGLGWAPYWYFVHALGAVLGPFAIANSSLFFFVSPYLDGRRRFL
ncbi:hypothetical protein HDU97_006273 [Phlyctochytrium planicorne]|nr:hypothetical protein HDU97_006273 [Phlyctochytrium planicorne]